MCIHQIILSELSNVNICDCFISVIVNYRFPEKGNSTFRNRSSLVIIKTHDPVDADDYRVHFVVRSTSCQAHQSTGCRTVRQSDTAPKQENW
jgi:hypothetical protein